MSGELPAGWVSARLENLTDDVSYGYTASSTQERAGPHLLRITDIQENKVNWPAVPFCVIDESKKDKYLLQKGDLVFARTGATVGKSFLIRNEIPESVFASYLIRVRCTTNETTSYLSHYFNSGEYWEQITDCSSGIGQPNVNGSKLKELKIPIPPLAEQTRIAQKLDELLAQVDTLKARIDAIPALLKRFRQSVLAAAVSGRLTEEWRAQHVGWVDEGSPTSAPNHEIERWASQAQPNLRTEPFSALIKEMRNGLSAKPNEDGKGTPILRISSVRSGSVEQTGVRYLECSAPDQARYALKTGDLLFTRYNGSLDLVGVCGVVKRLEHSVLVYPDKLIRVRADESKILAAYLEVYFTSPNMREIVIALVKSTSGQKGISGQDLKSLLISYPSLIEQTEIVRRVEQLFAFADQLEAKVASAKSRIDHLTQSILAKAFRGELVPQDPNDEPASVLLERIKTQRAAAPKAKRGRKASA